MQKRNTITSTPLLISIALSIALHGVALYSQKIHSPPQPILDSGRTVVHLTLIPTLATQTEISDPSPANPKPEKTNPVDLIPAPVISTPEPAQNAPAPAISEELNASIQEDKGVITEAAISGPFRPPYPRISQRRGETGTVKLAIQVKADGLAGTVSILQSSGHRRLDEAAVNGAKKTQFIPAQKWGKNIETTVQLEFTFKLTDD